MPRGKRKILFNKQSVKKKKKIEIVTLSDSEDSKNPLETEDVITIGDDLNEGDHSVINLTEDTPCKESTDKFSFHIDRMPDFIPINTNKRIRPARRKIKTTEECSFKDTPVIKLKHPNLLSTNKNRDQPRETLRPVIIDGSNVAFRFGNGEFKAEGIIIVVEYFLQRGHKEVVCFLPEHYRHKCRTPEEDKILTQYEKKEILVYTPSRKLLGKQITPYDDRFIVQYASVRGGVVVSNDGYRDLLNEEKSFRVTIEKRILNYTFARGMFMLPKDPLGPSGPTLDEMLMLPKNETVISLL